MGRNYGRVDLQGGSFKMNIVVPLAGRGKRFADQGFVKPKPLINVSGKPMLFWALKSLENISYSRIIFVALKEHEVEFNVSKVISQSFSGSFELILLDNVTEGQLCTVLEARRWINVEEGLLIASADTYVVSNIAQEITSLPGNYHGLISVANMPGDRWSFARTDETGQVIEVAEKVRISDNASTGLYFFSNGKEFVSIADEMIQNQEKTRGEYYVIPVYQKYIQLGWSIGLSRAQEMHDLGTPEALNKFLSWLEK